MACVVGRTCPIHIGKNTEQDKPLTCATQSGSLGQPQSEQSDDLQSEEFLCFGAIEADTSTGDSNHDGTPSKTAMADGFDYQDQQAGSGDDDITRPGSQSSSTMLAEEAAQKQLEMMSQVVMEAWSKLQALESRLINSGDSLASTSISSRPSSETVGEAATQSEQATNQCLQQQLRLAASLSDGDVATKASQTYTGRSSRRDLKGLFGSGFGPIGHAQAVLTSAQHVLDSTPGVVCTAIELAAAGTMATLHVETSPNSQETTLLAVKAISKAALLEAAASTQIVYILGYEATPFIDNVCGTGFAGTLAITPHSRQLRACWDTLKKGRCPHGSKCKWSHPGRDQILPIQVVFRSSN